jgi:hypothetical protein
MRPYFLLLSSFFGLALCTLSAAGCSAKLGEKTDGENGALRFSYTNASGCIFGCGLDRPALQGSMVTVMSEGGNPDIRATARLVDPTVARIAAQTESCRCTSHTENSSESHSIDAGDRCVSGQTKECSLSLDVETSQAGDPKLEIVDGSGGLIDRVTLHVRPAARIDVRVKEGATEIGGVYEVKKGFKVKLESHVFDVDGGEAVFAKHGMSFDYGDESIVKPDTAVIFGSTEVEDMIAPGVGETTVKVRATGAEKVVRFRVVP